MNQVASVNSDDHWSAALVVFLVGIMVWTSCAAYLRRPFVGDEVDDGQYLAAAESLRQGTGYRLISRVGSPVARKYPPGVSFVTSLGMSLVPGKASVTEDQAVARSLMIACAIGLAIASMRFFASCGLEKWSSVVLALAILFHPSVTMFSAYLNADLPFAALTTWLAYRWCRRWQNGQLQSNHNSLMDGLIVSLTMLVRGNGLTLLAAGLVLCWLASPRVRVVRALIYLLPIALLIGGSMLLSACQRGSRDTGLYASEWVAAYGSQRHYFEIPVRNALLMPNVAMGAIWPMTEWTAPVAQFFDRSRLCRIALEGATSSIIIFGLWRLARRKLGPAILVNCVLTLLVFCVWHYPFDLRFGLPLLPLATVGFVFGSGALCKDVALPVPARRMVAGAMLAGSLIISTSVMLRAARHDGIRGEVDTQREVAFKAIRESTPPEAVIFCDIPEMIYLNTARQTAPIVDDARRVSKLPPTWKSLERWLQSCKGHPVYFYFEDFAERSSLSDSADGPTGSGQQFVPLFISMDRRYRIDRLTSVPAGAAVSKSEISNARRDGDASRKDLKR